MMAISDETLAGMTDERLAAGLARADESLRLMDRIEDFDPSEDFDGPFPPSGNFESWNSAFIERRRNLLKLGKQMIEGEMRRRNLQSPA
jgi:hypothetical protein